MNASGTLAVSPEADDIARARRVLADPASRDNDIAREIRVVACHLGMSPFVRLSLNFDEDGKWTALVGAPATHEIRERSKSIGVAIRVLLTRALYEYDTADERDDALDADFEAGRAAVSSR